MFALLNSVLKVISIVHFVSDRYKTMVKATKIIVFTKVQ